MSRSDLVLAALAASDGEVHTPVQVQKLMFLIDKNLSTHLGGPFYSFKPLDYGPFDAQVYRDLESLERSALVEIQRTPGLRWKTYRLTPKGQQLGEQVLHKLQPSVAEYLRQLSSWVRSLSFAELVSAIYAAYPDMKANSVFFQY